MKVFAIKANGSYCMGMAVVAAKSQEEAISLIFEATTKSVWRVRYDKPVSVEVLPVSYRHEAKVLSFYEGGE